MKKSLSLAALLFLPALFTLSAPALGKALASGPLAPNAPPPAPTNISCQGWEQTTVIIGWKDNATDENNYRLERSVNGGAFSQIAVINPDANGNYQAYRDTGINPSNRLRYRLRAFRSGDNSFSDYSAVCSNRRIFAPGAFRIFYGVEGTTDDCPAIDGNDVCVANTNDGSGNNVFVVRQNDVLVGSKAAFDRAGFTRAADAPPSGLDKIPVNVVWCDNGGCAGGSSLGLSPSLIETNFNLATRVGDPIAYLVPLHELFHFQQFKYWGLNDPSGGWVVEGQARSIQDKFCLGANRASALCFDDIAIGYAGYVPEINAYLGSPNFPLTQKNYQAALFWTYLSEKFGTTPAGETTEVGVDIFRRFWEDSAANPGRDGVAVINSMLASLGRTERFRDIWKDFAVANFAKNLTGPGVPSKYRYSDMAELGGSYAPVMRSLSQTLGAEMQIVDTDETVYPWGANYYVVYPENNVPTIDIRFTQETPHQVYYTILGIKNDGIALEYNLEARNLSRTIFNDGYYQVVVIVAGLENLANYRYSFNGARPFLNIKSPTSLNQARVGDRLAPEKFLVTVEIVDGNGIPLPGIDLGQFRFHVGDAEILGSGKVISSTVMGQHWFVLRAPTQPVNGVYPLTVRYSTTLSDTEAIAINYIPRTDMDNILLIDRSGSMSVYGKMEAAKAASRLFVDSWRNGDKLGVISFANSPSNPVDMQLTDWTDAPMGGSRQTAFNAINALTASGATNIGDTLRKGWDELKARGDSTHDWTLALVSDGKEEAVTPAESFDTMIARLRDATDKRPRVFSVAVGPDADRPRMQLLSTLTGGTYHFVSVPTSMMGPQDAAESAPGLTNRLVDMRGPTAVSNFKLDMDLHYRMMATQIADLQSFFTFVGPLANDNDPLADVVTIPVEGSAAEMTLSLSWDPTTGYMDAKILKDPLGNDVLPFKSDARHVVWRVPNPTAGDWTLTLTTLSIGAPQPAEAPQVEWLPVYLVQGSLRSEVTLDAFITTPVSERKAGKPVHIAAGLSDTGPLPGGFVDAAIIDPNGAVHYLALLDDGAHGDGSANDGLYGGTFYQTGYGGDYQATVNATGISALAGIFSRQEMFSFHFDSPDDSDGDGLPDDWEIEMGTDPNVPDSAQDPDRDGWTNWEERDQGTHPNDADSDDGGEADGTDANPLDPADDAVQPPRLVAYPGNGKIYLKYSRLANHAGVDFYKASSFNGPFSFLDSQFPTTGIFSDTAVTNGQEYCYTAVGITLLGDQSAWLTPSCATPRSDPYPPHGSVFINGGASQTFSVNVMLSLSASDSVDPHVVTPDESIPLPPADSASGVTEMMVSDRADFAGAEWEPFSATKPWTLAQTSGLATVFAKFRDAQGNESEVVSAGIIVGRTAPGAGLLPVFLPLMGR